MYSPRTPCKRARVDEVIVASSVPKKEGNVEIIKKAGSADTSIDTPKSNAVQPDSLPDKLEILLTFLRAMQRYGRILTRRGQYCTFASLQGAVEGHCQRTLRLQHVRQIKHLVPRAFHWEYVHLPSEDCPYRLDPFLALSWKRPVILQNGHGAEVLSDTEAFQQLRTALCNIYNEHKDANNQLCDKELHINIAMAQLPPQKLHSTPRKEMWSASSNVSSPNFAPSTPQDVSSSVTNSNTAGHTPRNLCHAFGSPKPELLNNTSKTQGIQKGASYSTAAGATIDIPSYLKPNQSQNGLRDGKLSTKKDAVVSVGNHLCKTPNLDNKKERLVEAEKSSMEANESDCTAFDHCASVATPLLNEPRRAGSKQASSALLFGKRIDFDTIRSPDDKIGKPRSVSASQEKQRSTSLLDSLLERHTPGDNEPIKKDGRMNGSTLMLSESCLQLLAHNASLKAKGADKAEKLLRKRQQAVAMLPNAFDILQSIYGAKGPVIRPKAQILEQLTRKSTCAAGMSINLADLIMLEMTKAVPEWILLELPSAKRPGNGSHYRINRQASTSHIRKKLAEISTRRHLIDDSDIAGETMKAVSSRRKATFETQMHIA